jgi:P27 family predicted phage terminase small subunit
MREKKLRGTIRKDRMLKPTALDRLRTAPPAPAHLSERARVEWKALARVCVELGVLTSADLRALELLCECLATEHELRETLKAEGLTIAGAGNNKKTHPASRLLESTRNQAMRLLTEFGLTPKGRVGVDMKPPPPLNINGANDDLARRYFDRRPWEHRE